MEKVKEADFLWRTDSKLLLVKPYITLEDYFRRERKEETNS